MSYHCPYFFLEVMPRINRLSLLLLLNFADIKEAPDIASDATEWQFIVHSKHSGGVLLQIKTEQDIRTAMALITQAYTAVRSEPLEAHLAEGR